MSKSLQDFVKNHREAFDDKEPDDHAWKNIESSLPQMKQRSLWNSVVMWRAAALLFMGLSLFFFLSRPLVSKDSATALSLQKDFSNLESFYTSEIASKVAMINDYENANDLDQFTQDFQKLDAMYLVLKEEMKTRPSQKVKDALILNMLIRIDLLNQQLHSLDKVDKDSLARKDV